MTRPIELAGGSLRLRFEWQQDRYARQIFVRDGGVERLWLTSREGLDESPWPPSPPLQQVHVETRPGGIVVALAVGMAGRSHWSASFELDPHSSSMACDVACRCNLLPERLGSNYQVHSPVAWRLVPLDDAQLLSPPHDTELLHRIEPRAVIEAVPATFRWRYLLTR